MIHRGSKEQQARLLAIGVSFDPNYDKWMHKTNATIEFKNTFQRIPDSRKKDTHQPTWGGPPVNVASYLFSSHHTAKKNWSKEQYSKWAEVRMLRDKYT